jgi:hypothetical protein
MVVFLTSTAVGDAACKPAPHDKIADDPIGSALDLDGPIPRSGCVHRPAGTDDPDIR